MTTPPTGATIEVAGLTKRFASVLAVDDLSFTVGPGRVTGFLGPNGAGKTTTLRCLLGLVAPTPARATIGGRTTTRSRTRCDVVGAALEATGFHPGRTRATTCACSPRAAGVDEKRAEEVLDLVGLNDSAKRPVGGFSLGMRQRLQLAAALLGDPGVLVLDEPANGLDPEGIAWLRVVPALPRRPGPHGPRLEPRAVGGEQTVDDVVIIARGRLVRACTLDQLTADHRHVVVRTPTPQQLCDALAAHAPAATVTAEDGALHVVDSDAAVIGRIAFEARVELHELRPAASDLEQVFLSLTGGATS